MHAATFTRSGIVFFELLTGQRPFSGDSFPSIQKAHLSPTRPSIRSYDSELPSSYEQLVQKLLQIDPANRFQSPKDLLAALSRLGVNSGRSALLPQFDQVANAEKTRVSSVPQPSASVTGRTNRRWQVITAVRDSDRHSAGRYRGHTGSQSAKENHL